MYHYQQEFLEIHQRNCCYFQTLAAKLVFNNNDFFLDLQEVAGNSYIVIAEFNFESLAF